MLFPPLNDFICSNHMLINVVIQIVISINREYQFRQQQLYYHEIVLGKLLDRKKYIYSTIIVIISLQTHFKSNTILSKEGFFMGATEGLL